MEGPQRKREAQGRRLSIIDVSSADDSLIDPLSGNAFDHQDSENQECIALLETPNSKKFEDAASKVEQWEEASQLKETFEAEKTKKNSKCNLRKSLAWDSAFFTSEGVLDAEELSTIIEGVEKDEKHVLPVIQEDVYKSCDSISTMESDNLTLSSMEADLFEDIRASIQKSSKKSNIVKMKNKVLSAVASSHTRDSLKKTGMTPQSKARTVSQNPSPSTQGSGKMTKKNHVSSQVSQKLVATRGEPSILKQPKILGKSSPSSTISAKRASLGGLHVKGEKDKEKRVIGGRLNTVSGGAPIPCSSQCILPKPTLSSKSSSGPSVATKTKFAVSASSGGSLSDNISNSTSHFLKRKVGAGIVKPPSSSSSVKTPSKVSRNKTKVGNPSLAASSMSATKMSSSISPASSTSDWSSESLSSNCTSKQKSNYSRTSLDSISGRKALSDTDTLQALKSQVPASDPNLEGHQTPATGFVSKCERTTFAGTVLQPAPAKPSGLRLPSPKIGFFDGVKSLVRTPRGETQSCAAVTRGLPKYKTGKADPSEGLNKTQLGKLQLAESSMLTENPGYQQPSHPITLSGSSVSGNETFNASLNVEISSEVSIGDKSETHIPTGAGKLEGRKHSTDIRATSTNVERNNSDSSSLHFENKSSSKTVGEGSISDQFDLLKVEDAAITRHDGDMHIPDASSTDNNEIMNSSVDKVSLKGNNAMRSTNNRFIPTDGDRTTHVSSFDHNVENTSHFHIAGKASVECQFDLLNHLHPIKCANDQKASHYDGVVDCLSRQADSIDIKTEIQESGDDSLSISQSATSILANFSAPNLPCHRELPCFKWEESLDGSLPPSLPLSSTSFDMVAPGRIPFAVKDSFCNMDGFSNVLTESTVAEVKRTTSTTSLSLPKSIMKENN